MISNARIDATAFTSRDLHFRVTRRGQKQTGLRNGLTCSLRHLETIVQNAESGLRLLCLTSKALAGCWSPSWCRILSVLPKEGSSCLLTPYWPPPCCLLQEQFEIWIAFWISLKESSIHIRMLVLISHLPSRQCSGSVKGQVFGVEWA